VESTRKLQANIVSLATRSASSAPPPDNAIAERLDRLEREMRLNQAIKDSMSIQYSGLGFCSERKSNAWVEIHQPSADYGLIMDFTCVMEHVWTQIVGQKMLANLEKVYKMKLHTNNQAVTITSFETRIPNFFGGESRSIGVVKEWES